MIAAFVLGNCVYATLMQSKLNSFKQNTPYIFLYNPTVFRQAAKTSNFDSGGYDKSLPVNNIYDNHFWEIGNLTREKKKQEGFLRCQTPTSTVRLKVEGCRVNNGGCKIKSEEWRVGVYHPFVYECNLIPLVTES